MLITWLGHAQLFVNAAGKTILIDPWFSEPVFGGAWFRYPPAPYPNASTLPKPDVLLLSHIHPDHSGPETLKQLARSTPTYAMPFPSGALKRRLDRVGHTNVSWLEQWSTKEVAPGLKITFVPHHRGWEVSSIIVEADGVRLYHGNDNPLSVEAYKEIVTRLGPIDIAFLPYAGASSYPTGFDGSKALLAERCAQKKKEGLQRFTDGIEGLAPAEAVPFASSWALLEPSELWKNYLDRPTQEEALAHAIPKAAEVGTRVLHMDPGDEWNKELGVTHKGLTGAWSSTRERVEVYAKQEAARVAAAIATNRPSSAVPDHARFDAAFREYFAAMFQAMQSTIADLDMRAGFSTPEGLSWNVTFTPKRSPTIEAGLSGNEDEVLQIPIAELWMILAGPANWEDVWYGYRLHVRKREGAGYYRAFWEMLLNFDDEPISETLSKRAS